MKKIYLLTILLTFATGIVTIAQTKNDYASQWKKAEAFEKKGLTKSAQTEVNSIYKSAIAANNSPQVIKAAIYLAKYKNMLEENSTGKNIFFFDTLISQAKAPAKNVLQSIQAEMYLNFLQNNRYRIYNRTKTEEEKSNDLNTWSIDKLTAVISSLYKSSLKNDAVLKSTKIDNYDAIITKGENTRSLRPALYDFLLHRALDYFTDDERYITKPAYQFTINNEKAFAPAAEFINTKFETKDTVSLHYNVLLLLQDILRFHISDAKPDALIDADLIRLNFVHQHAITENKEKLYEAALKNIEERYADNPASAQAIYLRAEIYHTRGKGYEAHTNTENQYEIKRAKELCDLIIKKFPKSEGGSNAQNLLKQITTPSLSLTSEEVNIIGQPFRVLINYKNSPTVYLRIIKTSKAEIDKIDNQGEKSWQTLIDLKPLKSWSVTLPDPGDFQVHSVEIKNDALNSGVYYLLASCKPDFSLDKNIISSQELYVSNISYVFDDNEYYVLHRDSGEPLAGTQVQIWQSTYNPAKSKYDLVKKENYTADKNGHFTINQPKEYRNIRLQLNNGTDELFLDEETYNRVYSSYDKDDNPTRPQAFLFTDRSIYRPGQIVYFKGILITQNKTNKRSEILTGYKTKIQLQDANYQKVSEIEVTTNEYGSYKGSFKLPEGSLNGIFTLFDTAANQTEFFSVEEYKRPKFYVEVQKPKGTYRLNDSISVTGLAKAYAGNNIDGAQVKYRVVRKVRYPIWWEDGYYGRGKIYPPYGRQGETEITNGIATTGINGEFIVKFKALPDESVDKKGQPVFYYEVNADVTDINGETRSGNTSVAVAYQALQLNITLPEKLPADSLKDLKIYSANLNDIFESAKVNVTINKVQSPGKIFRERYWDMPDQFIMSKDEYYTYFPYDIYKDEDKIAAWLLGEKAIDKTDSTKENSQFSIPNTQLSAGWYKIIAVTKDKYGEEVKAEKYIELTDEKGINNNEAITVNTAKATAEPGEKIEYSIKTGFDKIWLVKADSRMDSKPTTVIEILSNTSAKKYAIPVTEKDRGGAATSYVFVKHNQVYDGSERFTIPWSNKELNISFETFRDKLLPGSEEKWAVKISGNKGEKITAELLAGMYDASLDQFSPHKWNPLPVWPLLPNEVSWDSEGFQETESEALEYNNYEETLTYTKSYDQLQDVNLVYGAFNMYFRSSASPVYDSMGESVSYAYSVPKADMQVKGAKLKAVKMEDGLAEDETLVANQAIYSWSKEPGTDEKTDQSPATQIRKNFNETAFFYPDLKTDENGNVSFSFTIPEALTQWKLMTFAHTKDLASGYKEKTAITQKPLMVQPNAPRFLREGDKMEFSAKVINMQDKPLTGNVTLELLDAATYKPVDISFKNNTTSRPFTVEAGRSIAVKFPIEIPLNYNSALTYRIIAKSSNASDGEEMALPVLTNRMLVTETMPLNVRGTNHKEFKFEKLLNSGNSKTLSNHALTVEYTSNPAWYAVQALPYLMEYPYECAEQTFNRYYANILASFVANSTPAIKAVFEKWKIADTAALLSNLQKNEELKSALLQETPWVLDAQNETQQKKNIALLFDMVRLSTESAKTVSKLKEMQSSNGGFTWFKGGPDDRYITQYILTGIGHLKKLDALSTNDNKQLNDVKPIIKAAIPYLDKKIKEDYDYLVKHKTNLKNNNLSYTAIQYLYMRSFFTDYTVPAASQTAYNYYRTQAQKYWLQNSKYMQAMIALALHRTKDVIIPKAIIKSLKENSINNEEMGMYWKDLANGGYYWYQAPVESQALLIEAFTDIDKNTATINDLKTWLLKQKQTQNWKTTKATAEACYAILLSGPAPQRGNLSSLLDENKEIMVTLGSTTISSNNNTEAGTGYFKKRIEGENINPSMGNIGVTINSSESKSPPLGGWGAVYWQYFEDLDKITPASTPLKLSKKLYVENNSDRGPVLKELKDGDNLKTGDKVKVRIELRVDRDMEYVHMKDMRASCMEPVNVISSYKWQDGLGYYESTKDASTNFFFGWLPKGTYVFEYPMFVTTTGNFSNGITTIQCMYAPEFTSHSEGIRVNVNQ